MYSAWKIPFTVQFKQRIRAIETKRIREHKQHDIADHLATIGIDKQHIQKKIQIYECGKLDRLYMWTGDPYPC